MGPSLLLTLVGCCSLGEAVSVAADAPPRMPITKPSEQLDLKSKTVKSMPNDQPGKKAGARKTTAPKSGESSAKTAAAASRRLPRFYSQLELEEDQQQTVRELQQRFAEQISALREEITKLQKQREEQLEAVLKPTQKRRLKELRTQSTPPKK